MKTTLLFVGDENGLRDVSPQERKKKDERVSTATHDKAYGKQLKRTRQMLGKTQQEMADAIGIHQVTYCRIETATTPLTDNMRDRIRAAVERFTEEN